MRNALYTVGFFGESDWVRANVRWVAAAVVINDNEVWPKPNKVTTLRNPGDYLANIIGLTNGRTIDPTTIGDHFFSTYVSQIDNSMLWPMTTGNSIASQRFDQREVIVDNQTDEVITVRFTYETKAANGAFAWLPIGEYFTRTIPANKSDYLSNNGRIKARNLRIWAESVSGVSWDRNRTTPINLVPDGSYVTSGIIGDHRVVFRKSQPTHDTAWQPFCDQHFDQNDSPVIRRGKWFQVSERGALCIDERGNLQVFRKSEANPPDPGPFGTLSNLFATCYVFVQVSPPTIHPELVMLPKNGLGIVRGFSFDPSGFHWKVLGDADTYNTLKHTIWRSRYTTASGQWVTATITFNGADGRYVLQNASAHLGQLGDIQYYEDSATFFIQGKWSLQGSVGWFRFDQERANRDAFTGFWGFGQPFGAGGQKGVWNGHRIVSGT